MTARHPSRIAWIALMAIIWHGLMPLAHAATQAPTAWGSICSAAGLIDAGSGEQPQGGTTVDLSKQCPLCAAGAHFALPPAVQGVPVAPLRHLVPPAIRRHTSHAIGWLNFSSRAPPSFDRSIA